ncbi:MAG: OmpA family protein [Nannocystaceae bacterium]
MRSAILPLAVFLLPVSSCKKDELQAALDEANSALEQTSGELDAQQLANEQLSSRNQSLEARVAELESEIVQLESQIENLAEKAGLTAKELAELRREKAKRVAELQVYKDLIGRLRSLIDAGTISIEFRKGRMVVKLSDSILFDSGRTKLKASGQSALAELARALNTVGERDFLIAGHTDNIPIRNARFKSNWALSTARAVEVVHYLVDQGMNAVHLGAAGFGEFDPVGDNNGDDGRSENRRIEIILMPRLGDIPGMKEMLTGSSR